MDGYQLIADDYHHASAHPFEALDFLFSRADLALHVLVKKHINFFLTIRNKSAVAADNPDIMSAETPIGCFGAIRIFTLLTRPTPA